MIIIYIINIEQQYNKLLSNYDYVNNNNLWKLFNIYDKVGWKTLFQRIKHTNLIFNTFLRIICNNLLNIQITSFIKTLSDNN